MKTPEPKKNTLSDKSIEASRRLDIDLGGKGVEITIGSPETGGIKSYFNNKMPLLEITTHNVKRKVAVEVSSVEQENNKLLHFLFSKTISG